MAIDLALVTGTGAAAAVVGVALVVAARLWRAVVEQRIEQREIALARIRQMLARAAFTGALPPAIEPAPAPAQVRMALEELVARADGATANALRAAAGALLEHAAIKWKPVDRSRHASTIESDHFSEVLAVPPKRKMI
jgi:hypothetical protein